MKKRKKLSIPPQPNDLIFYSQFTETYILATLKKSFYGTARLYSPITEEEILFNYGEWASREFENFFPYFRGQGETISWFTECFLIADDDHLKIQAFFDRVNEQLYGPKERWTPLEMQILTREMFEDRVGMPNVE
jgi:hypothetical protein